MTVTEQIVAPASYATGEQARAYVAAVLARPGPAGPPRVYVIISPAVSDKLTAMCRRTLPGATMLFHADVFGAEHGKLTAADRIPQIASSCDGALVIPRTLGTRTVIGLAAAAEADGLASLGLPVLVRLASFADALVAWPDVRTREPDEPAPRWGARELDLPRVPKSPLPTVLASYRALGLSR